MKPSPLVLEFYFATELIVSANKNHNGNLPAALKFDDLDVHSECLPAETGEHSWQVTLKLAFQPKAGSNYSYTFTLELIGFFKAVVDGIPMDIEERLVRTNGCSMLYGAAREIVRSATSHGPFAPILLPSVSFYPIKESAKAADDAPVRATD